MDHRRRKHLRIRSASTLNLGLMASLWSKRKYAVCVNTIPVPQARKCTGDVPEAVQWLDSNALVPHWLRPHVDAEMAEGVAWKLAPVRVFPESYEISLDNDVILWAIPQAMEQWLQSPDLRSCLLAGDLRPALGQFAAACRNQPVNTGIRGLPPGFDLETRLQQVLARYGLDRKSTRLNS